MDGNGSLIDILSSHTHGWLGQLWYHRMALLVWWFGRANFPQAWVRRYVSHSPCRICWFWKRCSHTRWRLSWWCVPKRGRHFPAVWLLNRIPEIRKRFFGPRRMLNRWSLFESPVCISRIEDRTVSFSESRSRLQSARFSIADCRSVYCNYR